MSADSLDAELDAFDFDENNVAPAPMFAAREGIPPVSSFASHPNPQHNMIIGEILYPPSSGLGNDASGSKSSSPPPAKRVTRSQVIFAPVRPRRSQPPTRAPAGTDGKITQYMESSMRDTNSSSQAGSPHVQAYVEQSDGEKKDLPLPELPSSFPDISSSQLTETLPAAPAHPTNFDLSSQSISGDFQAPPFELDLTNTDTFLYPVDFPVRDYQRNIVRKALVRNLICALPTGLGKTFIASVVMWNWYRWTKTAKVIFLAPTRPLISQQVESFLRITGVSINDVCVFLKEAVRPGLRLEEWQTKRVFFATPQTVELDLKAGHVDAASVVCLVLDEAHRATGNYSYVNVVKLLKNKNSTFRILGLTATPSGHYEGVQTVVDNLICSSTEMRTEQSLDVRSFVHTKVVKKIVLEYSDDQAELLQLAADSIQMYVNELFDAKVVFTKNAQDMHPFLVLNGLQEYTKRSQASGRSNNPFIWKVRSVGMLSHKVLYAMSLLKVHGVFPFLQRLLSINDEAKKSSSKYIHELVARPSFKLALSRAKGLIYEDSSMLARRELFLGHPKLEKLANMILSFFVEHGAESRAIIFVELRESAAEIIWVLSQRCKGIVDARMFVGQASKGAAKGMTQKEQHTMLQKFKAGEPNVLVATSVAEEGIDIGEVDLVVCYDQSRSPIRSIQRMGRTGRKRDGDVFILMTKKEEDKLSHALGAHKWLQGQLQHNKGHRKVEYHPSPRILPQEASPKYIEVNIQVPPENEAAMAGEDIILALRRTPAKRKRQESPATKRAHARKNPPPREYEGFVPASTLKTNNGPSCTDGLTSSSAIELLDTDDERS